MLVVKREKHVALIWLRETGGFDDRVFVGKDLMGWREI